MFTLSQLPYPKDGLEPYLDEKTVTIHHDKHHQGYVDKLNEALAGQPELFTQEAEEIVANLDQVDLDKRETVKNNGGGHVNHNLYWQIMSPDGGGEPVGALAGVLEKTFGSLAKFKTQFIQTAKKQFASGWSWLAIDQAGQLKVYSTPNHETPLMRGEIPLLTVDVWEHAYYLKYQQDRAKHLENFWQVINWPAVEKRYQSTL